MPIIMPVVEDIPPPALMSGENLSPTLRSELIHSVKRVLIMIGSGKLKLES